MLSNLQILRLLADELGHQHGDELIPVGQHAVQATISLRLKGSIKQLPAQAYTPTADIPLLSVLAIVARKLGARAPALYDLIIEAAVEAQANDEKFADYLDFSNQALMTVKARLREGLPPKQRKGKLERILTLSDVDVSGASFTPGRVPLKRRGA